MLADSARAKALGVKAAVSGTALKFNFGNVVSQSAGTSKGDNAITMTVTLQISNPESGNKGGLTDTVGMEVTGYGTKTVELEVAEPSVQFGSKLTSPKTEVSNPNPNLNPDPDPDPNPNPNLNPDADPDPNPNPNPIRCKPERPSRTRSTSPTRPTPWLQTWR